MKIWKICLTLNFCKKLPKKKIIKHAIPKCLVEDYIEDLIISIIDNYWNLLIRVILSVGTIFHESIQMPLWKNQFPMVFIRKIFVAICFHTLWQVLYPCFFLFHGVNISLVLLHFFLLRLDFYILILFIINLF